MLREGSCFSLAELATSFGVCERTVQRDLLLLKKAGVQVQFDAGTRTYRVVSLAEASPSRSLQSDHAKLLVTAARSSFLYGMPDRRPAIESAITALLGVDSTSDDPATVTGPVETTADCIVSAPRAVLMELGRPLVQRRAVKAKIEHPTTGWEWRLTLVPLQLLVTDEKPALLAKSPHSETFFLIDLETIRKASPTEETYEVEAPTENEILQAQRLF